ncbi:hypothetical protein KM92DES2_11959 [uncultured Desulfovibrio sp.]|uniref:Uncharacterized protein n=1 Tax=uncultured Desulfovibrio sp. TaxID=167968 RepID=A0A212JZ42_9BACT|nr:hypothetical protein KM92DES2_11959 [uncultured Desulfovibrio sp.]
MFFGNSKRTASGVEKKQTTFSTLQFLQFTLRIKPKRHIKPLRPAMT